MKGFLVSLRSTLVLMSFSTTFPYIHRKRKRLTVFFFFTHHRQSKTQFPSQAATTKTTAKREKKRDLVSLEKSYLPNIYIPCKKNLPLVFKLKLPVLHTMSDQEFEILDFLFSLKTPVPQTFPNHFWVLLKYEYRVFKKGEWFEREQEFL